MHTAELKKKVIELRKKGYSYSRITEETAVPHSTLSYWLTNIEVKLSKSTLKRAEKNKRESILRKKAEKKNEVELIRNNAKQILGLISKRDLLIAGTALYWGEGKKYKETVSLTNSNPKMVKFFVSWLTLLCKVPIEDLRAEIHAYPDNNLERSKRFWSKTTGIPTKHFYKTQIDQRTSKKTVKNGVLPHGTINIYMKANTVSIRQLHRQIMTWVDIISNEELFAEVV